MAKRKTKSAFISREEGAKIRSEYRLQGNIMRNAYNIKLGKLATKSPDTSTAKNILLEMKSLLKNKRLSNPKAFSFFDNQLFGMVTDALNSLK